MQLSASQPAMHAAHVLQHAWRQLTHFSRTSPAVNRYYTCSCVIQSSTEPCCEALVCPCALFAHESKQAGSEGSHTISMASALPRSSHQASARLCRMES